MKKILITLLIFSFISVPQVFGINENKIQTTAIEDIKVKNGAVLGLDDCIAIALNNNPSIKNARYNYGISRAQVGLARSEFFPTIGVGTGYDYTKIHAKRFNYDTNVYNINAQLNQLLFNFGKTNARIKMEKFYLIADEYNFYNTVRETIFNVKQKYYEVLASRASVLINRAYAYKSIL